MSAQRGCLSEAGSHKAFDESLSVDVYPKLVRSKAFDERSTCDVYPEAGSHKAFDECSAWMFIRSWFAQGI